VLPAACVRSLTLGVVLGLITGAGTLAIVGAGEAGVANAFLPITPCRLLDTRLSTTVGPRNTPLGAAETYTVQVTGANGQCNIPASATAIVVNVTGVSPTARTFVTLFPADASRPTASNLNFVAGQGPTPNLVTVSLSAIGAMKLYNHAGTVQLVGDIAGYYQPVGPGPAGPAGNPNRASNQQIAMLQWGNQVFDTGAAPYAVAYDGTSIWITNRTANTVSRVDPLSGARTDFATGSGPRGVAYDGTYVWVANHASNTLSRFVPATGARTDFPTGAGPEAIAWDGNTLWVTNSASNTVWSMDPVSGLAVEFATGASPAGVAFDGQNIWVVNAGSDNVTRIVPSAGTSSTIAVGDQPFGIAFDGVYMWVTNFGSDTVTRIDTFTFVTNDFATGRGPAGIAVAGTSLWIGNNLRNTLTSFDAAGNRTFVELAGVVGQIAYDGRSLWVLAPDDDKVTRVVLP